MSSRKKRRKPSRKREETPSPAAPPTASSSRVRISALAAVVAVASIVVVGYLALRARSSATGPTGWNVVLVSVDTLRADYVISSGPRPVATPGFDRIADEGVSFENAVTVSPTTLPSHASLFTAATPLVHGVHDNVGFVLGPEPDTLASHLQRHGYQTGAFIGAFVLDGRFGLNRGFDVYDDDLEPTGEMIEEGFVAQRRGGRVVARALEWMEEQSSRPDAAPFFAFLHLYDPHTPYAPPESFAPRDAAADLPNAFYGAEVAYVDALVGQLLDWLDTRGLATRTLVVLVSDHGESLGEHGEQTHGLFVYQSTLRIPWLLRYPGSPRGARVSGRARIVDLAPTVVELLGLPPMSGARESEGRNLVAWIDDSVNDSNEDASAAYAETFVPRLHYGWSELRSLERDGYKLILAPQPELYHLERDPAESRNLIEDEPALARSLLSELEGLITSEDRAQPEESLDRESLEKLQALGYAAGAGRASPEILFSELPDPKSKIEVYRVLNDPSLQSLEPADPRFPAALSQLRLVRERDPNIPRSHVLYGEMLLKAGQAEEAEAVFASLVALSGGRFDGHYGLGVARARQRNWNGAVEAFTRAMEIEPSNTRSLFQLAEVARQRGDLELAAQWLQKAIHLAPDRILQDRLAALRIEQGRDGEARAILESLAADPRDGLAAYNLAQFLLQAGELEKAREHFDRASVLRPKDPDVQIGLGHARVAMGELELAVAAFGKAVELAPCWTTALGNLGSAYGQRGLQDEAAQAFETAIACDPNYALGYRNLAAIRLEKGDLPGAIAAMRGAVRADPDDRELRTHLDELVRYQRRNN